MLHILPTSANETIGEEIGDYSPVLYNAFAWSAQPKIVNINTRSPTVRCPSGVKCYTLPVS